MKFSDLTYEEKLKRFKLFGTIVGLVAIVVFFLKMDLLVAIALSAVVVNSWYREIQFLELQIKYENLVNSKDEKFK